MWSLIAAPWFRYVLAGAAGIALLALVLGKTYQKGYQASDLRWRVKWAEEEQARSSFAQAQAERITKAFAEGQKKANEIRSRIDALPIPDNVESCVDPLWLHTFNDSVQIANGP